MTNRVKNEEYDAEINAMALELKMKYQKSSSTTMAAITPNKADHTQKNNQQQIPECFEDAESIKGRFIWKSIGEFAVPCIIRVIKGEHIMFIATRVAEFQLLNIYLKYLHADIFKCTSVKWYFITILEANLLNEINVKYIDFMYGKEIFVAGQDIIVRLEDVVSFLTFAETSYNKLLSKQNHGDEKKCGFIEIDSKSVVPYCIKNNQKYVPTFFFEGQIENLLQQSIEISGWELAHFKFCCLVLGIKEELFSNDSCLMANIINVKKFYPPGIEFKEFWPDKRLYSHLINQNDSFMHTNLPNAWLKEPPQIQFDENSTNISKVQGSVIPQSTSVIMNNYESNIEQAPSTSRGYFSDRNIAVQATSVSYVVPPPPLIGNALQNTNVITVSPSMTDSNIISNQVPQLSSQRAGGRSQAHQQQFQPHQIQQHHTYKIQQHQQPRQQQQQIITTNQTQKTYSSQSLDTSSRGRINTKERNNLRNSRSNITNSIDVSSLPSSLIPQTVQVTSLHPTEGCNLMKIPDQACGENSRSAYKIQKTILEGKTFHCINLNPYIYSDKMVTINDLVNLIFRSTTVARCALILSKRLKVTLYSGNFEQITILKENKCIRSSKPEDTPLAKLQEIIKVLPQLKSILYDPKKS